MSNQFFDNYRDMLLGGGSPTGYVDWEVDTIKAALIDISVEPVPNLSMDTRSQLTALGVVSEVTLSGVTVGVVATGTVDADNPTFPTVSGEDVEWIVFWKDTGNPATSPLLYLMDTFATGTPIPSTGTSAQIRLPDNGIFTIG